MIRLVTRTDVHLSDKGPQSRTDDWASAVLDKLKQVGLVAEKVGASAVLDNGDFFHIKSPQRNSHDLIRRVADLHAKYPCPVYANVGNHDCVYGDIRYLDKQPLGVLFSTGVFQRCYDEYEAVFEKDGVKVRVVGIPYHGTEYQMERFVQLRKGDENHLIVMAHVLASPQGGSMFEGEDIVRYQDLADLDPDVWVFGHWHKDQGVVRVGEKLVVNIGSLTRGSLSQDDLNRKPACSVLTCLEDRVEVSVVRLRVAPSAQVFDLEKKFRGEVRDMTVSGFVEALQKTVIEDQGTPLEDLIRQSQGVPELIRERALSYLERVG